MMRKCVASTFVALGLLVCVVLLVQKALVLVLAIMCVVVQWV